jgi:hypothetical protein
MKKLADALWAFVVVVFTLGVLAFFGLIAYYCATQGFWVLFAVAVFFVLLVVAAVLKGVTAVRR